LLELPNFSRALLAKKLTESLDEAESSDSQAAWIAVAERWAKELEDGVVQGIAAEEVMRKLREKLATSRES
jgi:hypothetical protein